MSGYNHILVAKHDKKNKCLAKDGELLIAASPKQTSSVKLRKSDHFFVGLESGKPALYGWVEAISEEISNEDLIKKILVSAAREFIGEEKGEIEIQIKLTLDAIKKLKPGTPVVTDFTEKSFMDKTLVQKVHKVFLRSLKK